MSNVVEFKRPPKPEEPRKPKKPDPARSKALIWGLAIAAFLALWAWEYYASPG